MIKNKKAVIVYFKFDVVGDFCSSNRFIVRSCETCNKVGMKNGDERFKKNKEIEKH